MKPERPVTRLIWIRHGQARAADGTYDDDTPLSPVGRAQAATLPSALGPETPTALYSSPLARARQTAEPIAEAFDLDLRIDPRIAEFGMADATLEGVRSRPNRTVWRATDRATPDSETSAAFHRRVAGFCEAVVAAHPDQRVVVVAHVGVIDAALRWVVGLDADAPWLYELPCVGNGSITEFHHWPRGAVAGGPVPFSAIERLGDAAHLVGGSTAW